jgi:hypothetical protein
VDNADAFQMFGTPQVREQLRAVFSCEVVPVLTFERMEEVVRTCAFLSRNKNAYRIAQVVTDDITKLSSNQSAYVHERLDTGINLRGVTWTNQNQQPYTIWLNPGDDDRSVTTLHELCHAFVATGTSHDETFRKLYHRALFHWDRLTNAGWRTDAMSYEVIQRYTVQGRWEDEEDYRRRCNLEFDRNATMAMREQVRVETILKQQFLWDI